MDPYNYEGYGQCEVGAPDFRSVAKIGTKAPDFTLTDLNGKSVSLAEFKGKKHVLLEFGSITWPPFVGEVPSLTQLREKYHSKDFEFFIVYVREAHPGENFPHHRSFGQKLGHARKLRELETVGLPILVDGIEGSTHAAYGLLPNMVYLIDRDGIVVYKSDWTDAQELEGMCESLVRLGDMKARQVPIIRKAVSERLHWIPMDPQHRERIYRRSGEKAIRDYKNAKGHLPYATDAEKAGSGL
ncbi:MAG: redoxin domain-containing protein [Deltaproteobacteria bacterium]|nr:redoxin domain-containing protein [Deltaproteobacteria bacterium]